MTLCGFCTESSNIYPPGILPSKITESVSQYQFFVVFASFLRKREIYQKSYRKLSILFCTARTSLGSRAIHKSSHLWSNLPLICSRYTIHRSSGQLVIEYWFRSHLFKLGKTHKGLWQVRAVRTTRMLKYFYKSEEFFILQFLAECAWRYLPGVLCIWFFWWLYSIPGACLEVKIARILVHLAAGIHKIREIFVLEAIIRFFPYFAIWRAN